MISQDAAKKLVQHITQHMERESALLYPEAMRNTFMNDPYALLDLIRQEANLTADTMDAWMLEAQGRPAPKEEPEQGFQDA